MSILIKGMEMPTSCMDCPFKGFDRAGGRGNICTINDSITLHAVLDGVDVKFVRMGDCPLVPVVRCRDCKWWGDLDPKNRYTDCYCHVVEFSTEPDWYCADGERKPYTFDDAWKNLKNESEESREFFEEAERIAEELREERRT